ncbi:MAG: DUF1934 domain-containing protein [Clostridia bacterium]|nr:DUF1934 domain-containing protein [Clostridia bacterium]
MKVSVLQRSAISRYEGAFSSLSAFLLSAAPAISDSEEASFRGEGELSEHEGELTLSYREEESGVRAALSLAGDTLTLTRGGAELCFVRGKRTAFTYVTTYGRLPTEAYTERVDCIKKGSAYLITLVYTAVFSGIAQKNELRFKITVK